ncbi:MAG: redoxin domain-containing protein [Candidatus Aminicenantes bacterium]|nr:redoxin domain-containing protein [Candidatus Aminicenantes bacterium]
MKMRENNIKIMIVSGPILLFLVMMAMNLSLYSAQEIRPAVVGNPMPDFSLESYQGKQVTLSGFKGKTIILIFPRGLAAEGHWCHVCPYQYLELVEFDKMQKLREKHNTEILFVLPYDLSGVSEWVEQFSVLLNDIDNWKNPENPDDLDDRGKQRMTMAQKYFPMDFAYKKGEIPFPFPILVDSQKKISKGLGLFTTEWRGSKADQNIPAVFIVDEERIVQFKYISQNTFDRPSPEYLIKILSCIK